MSILSVPDPRLKQVAVAVAFPLDNTAQDALSELNTLMLDADGVGIAAPQIGLPLRIVIVASGPNSRYPDAPTMPITEMLNPQILHASEAMLWGWEGCLSVPGKRGRIARAETIDVSYCDRHGERIEHQFSGFVARVIQHELDHLDGICITERVSSPEQLIDERRYFELAEQGLLDVGLLD
ncbi:peptide deformylase [Aliagarivorans taiwanensis]|uniref:peptide deformylase n=1 Tax=Aliagarivorans taiwanensis TaxID=561966 RepID=UPI00040017FE|nr:peptide deformylase [Aliagarivorans taiwanensis]